MVKNRKLSVEELNRVSVTEYKGAVKMPVVVILDNVRSLNNIGSIFRTSDALGIMKIYLCGISATPPHPDIHRTALGAEDSVEWAYYENTEDAFLHLKNDGYSVFSLEQTTDSIDLRKFIPQKGAKYAFVFGNELKGVSQTVIDQCDGAIEIPQFGTKHSFNVSVTAGIVLWDFFTKLDSHL
ncbi:MAG: RNA methyltransferase [Tenuifilaceae bacterium]|jgi:tRNA G18 (ribose-2'-O)-methylase SpoU|nr:RNA methyltransferase [Tenuifilaceae bacterium]